MIKNHPSCFGDFDLSTEFFRSPFFDEDFKLLHRNVSGNLKEAIALLTEKILNLIKGKQKRADAL